MCSSCTPARLAPGAAQLPACHQRCDGLSHGKACGDGPQLAQTRTAARDSSGCHHCRSQPLSRGELGLPVLSPLFLSRVTSLRFTAAAQCGAPGVLLVQHTWFLLQETLSKFSCSLVVCWQKRGRAALPICGKAVILSPCPSPPAKGSPSLAVSATCISHLVWGSCEAFRSCRRSEGDNYLI